MKKNIDAAMRKKEKWENKQKKQAKILTVLGIAAIAVVAVALVLWAIFSIHQWNTRRLSDMEMKELFEDSDALPKEGDPLVGTWFYFTADGEKIHSKYVFTADGKLEVHMLDDTIPEQELYILMSSADYRIRKSTSELYVWAKDDEDAKDRDSVIVYDYKIEKIEGAYMMTWEYDGTVWRMVRGEQ